MEAHETYLSEQCQKQGLVYVPGAGVFDENGAVFLVTECSSEGADLTHPKFVGKDQWHSLYVSDRQAVVYLNPDPDPDAPVTGAYRIDLDLDQDLPDLRELSRAAGEVEVGDG
jgi:hypothetical protein